MRSIGLCVGVSFVLIVSNLVAEQTAQDHPLVHADQVVGTLGARELAVKRFTTLPKGDPFFAARKLLNQGSGATRRDPS